MNAPLTVYKASAGSGKTFTLTIEYIKLLIKDPLSYKQILAVTFTNKATEEMKMRILSQLYGLSRLLPDSSAYLEIIKKDTELSGYENESYALKVQANKITIKAVSQVGVIRAVQTLEQLSEGTPNNSLIECVEIVDYPAFKLRGFMHDTGRSYISIEDLKTQIRLLSRFKINTFHWHLTENQAWRFEVKAYPQLTHATAMTRHKGLFYTQEECTSLEKYAKMHGITIIPEIDMPGHSDAFVRAMGHDMQTAEGMKELKVILKEVAQTFPNAPFIHIGADEKRIVYPHFIKEIAAYIHQLGRKCVIWMPIQGEFSDVDMTQLWSTAGKMVKGIPNIDCRYNYINHFDVFADIVGIYKSNIYYQPKGNANLAGSVVALWNDHKLSSTKDMLMQNNFYASVLATAERLWIGGGKEYIEKGGTMLPLQGDEFESFRDWERRFIFHKSQSLISSKHATAIKIPKKNRIVDISI